MLEFYTVFDIVCVISFMRINLNRRKFILYGSTTLASSLLLKACTNNPNTFFVAVNGSIKGDNIAELRIDHLQASYLCGIIGASVTKTNKLAYLAGQQFPATQEELRGFELGAKSVNPKVTITSTFVGD